MVVDTLIEEIQDLNLTYLLLVQRLLRKDRATAIFPLEAERRDGRPAGGVIE
ncbi:flagellar transcriptional regulator FlhD [Azotobacter vinelandii]